MLFSTCGLSYKLLLQDFGDHGEVYRTLSDRLVQYVREKYPGGLEDVKNYLTLTEEEVQSIWNPQPETIQTQSLANNETQSPMNSETQLPATHETQSPATTKKKSSLLSKFKALFRRR